MVANVTPRALTPALWSQPSNFKATANFSFIALKLGDAARPPRVYCRVRPASRNHGSILRLFILKRFQSIHSFLGSTLHFSQRFTKPKKNLNTVTTKRMLRYLPTNFPLLFVRFFSLSLIWNFLQFHRKYYQMTQNLMYHLLYSTRLIGARIPLQI